MTEDIEAKLLAVAEAIADGFEVDWAALRARAPQLAGELDRLRAVAEIGGAYRLVRDQGAETGVDEG